MDNNDLYVNARELQKQLAKKVIIKDDFDSEIEFVCGVDVSYKKNIAQCSAVIVKYNSLETVEVVTSKSNIESPYIPGLFILRESNPILLTLKLLKKPFQLLLIDGHGILHPRRCGLACYMGITLDIPTVGVAKSLLYGSVQENGFVKYNKEVLGYSIKRDEHLKKIIYVSTGHKVSLSTSIGVVRSITKIGEWIPEPLRIADIRSKDYDNKENDQFWSFTINDTTIRFL
ncbi:endonuclease V [Candidatus Nitrosocosmicus arcticus]|uniref:Endonuclease V n=1 Tax=Candidatus Nitrosocosmicus arcticus TaxID=2035267 RepID=A0A557STR6_9ARCH|nr:endonuclease V [Candidatus Nitrosocosmicus arcticus]TVP40004.1 endonuclease V [Candidatus Nitrosocosmicus arcticus]